MRPTSSPVEAEWYLLSFAWRWQGEKKVHVLGLDDFPGYKPGSENDKPLAKALHALFDEADVTIAHNGDRFDRRKANARFLVHKLPPPSPYRTVDTLKVARQHFMFNSNRLGDLGKQLGIGTKLATGGFGTWRGCMTGDPAAWATMKKYNKQDVVLLEEIYDRLLPWMTNHPNMANIASTPDACPKCGAVGRMIVRGYYHVQTLTYPKYQCRTCLSLPPRSGAPSRRLAKPEYV